MLSLRYLNAAQNKLERLPTSEDPFEDELDGKRRKRKPKVRPELYTAPVLQELYLQDNRLEELPPQLFRLPGLSLLDVSNNKLRVLPAALWSAPALRDLNVALNHLRDLPTGHEVSGASDLVQDGPYVSNNKLRVLPAALWSAPALRDLNVALNHLRDLPTGHELDHEVSGAPDLIQDGLSLLDVSNNKLCILPAALWSAPALRDLNVALNHLRGLPTSHETYIKLRVLPAALWSAPALRDLNVALNHLRDLPTGHEVSEASNMVEDGSWLPKLAYNGLCWPMLVYDGPCWTKMGHAG
ncbi:hypothetical protein PYW07_013418 [Mythimna separata]|uniref:Uncharacterized protein n=1 Tax=Mythimna separata TaxID=271217 RepID=A0AAD8DK85_MYTSE|nr:hypothetical protein PYW07_013418 [Mythimna separata]